MFGVSWSPFTSAITATPFWAGMGAFGGAPAFNSYGFGGYGFGSVNPFYAALGFANTIGMFAMPSLFAPAYAAAYALRAAAPQGWGPPFGNTAAPPAAPAAPATPQPTPPSPPAAAAPQGTADWTTPKRDDEWAQKEGEGAATSGASAAGKVPGKTKGTRDSKKVDGGGATGTPEKKYTDAKSYAESVNSAHAGTLKVVIPADSTGSFVVQYLQSKSGAQAKANVVVAQLRAKGMQASAQPVDSL